MDWFLYDRNLRYERVNCDTGNVPIDIYVLNNGIAWIRSESWSKLIKIPEKLHWRRDDVFIINFEQISQPVTCNMWFCNLHLTVVKRWWRQAFVKVLSLPKVCTILTWFLYIIKSCNFSPFLRTCICFNSQRQKIYLQNYKNC